METYQQKLTRYVRLRYVYGFCIGMVDYEEKVQKGVISYPWSQLELPDILVSLRKSDVLDFLADVFICLFGPDFVEYSSGDKNRVFISFITMLQLVCRTSFDISQDTKNKLFPLQESVSMEQWSVLHRLFQLDEGGAPSENVDSTNKSDVQTTITPALEKFNDKCSEPSSNAEEKIDDNGLKRTLSTVEKINDNCSKPSSTTVEEINDNCSKPSFNSEISDEGTQIKAENTSDSVEKPIQDHTVTKLDTNHTLLPESKEISNPKKHTLSNSPSKNKKSEYPTGKGSKFLEKYKTHGSGPQSQLEEMEMILKDAVTSRDAQKVADFAFDIWSPSSPSDEYWFAQSLPAILVETLELDCFSFVCDVIVNLYNPELVSLDAQAVKSVFHTLVCTLNTCKGDFFVLDSDKIPDDAKEKAKELCGILNSKEKRLVRNIFELAKADSNNEDSSKSELESKLIETCLQFDPAKFCDLLCPFWYSNQKSNQNHSWFIEVIPDMISSSLKVKCFEFVSDVCLHSFKHISNNFPHTQKYVFLQFMIHCLKHYKREYFQDSDSISEIAKEKISVFSQRLDLASWRNLMYLYDVSPKHADVMKRVQQCIAQDKLDIAVTLVSSFNVHLDVDLHKLVIPLLLKHKTALLTKYLEGCAESDHRCRVIRLAAYVGDNARWAMKQAQRWNLDPNFIMDLDRRAKASSLTWTSSTGKLHDFFDQVTDGDILLQDLVMQHLYKRKQWDDFCVLYEKTPPLSKILKCQYEVALSHQSATNRSKSSIAKYLKFKGDILFVCDEDSTRIAEEYLSHETMIGFDVEFKLEISGRPCPPSIAILQISSLSCSFIFDIDKCPSFYGRWSTIVSNLFSNADVLKIGYGCKEDMKMISSVFPKALANFTNVLDLQHAESTFSSSEGFKCGGLSNLCQRFLSYSLDKDECVSNWCLRPLRESQLRYAALDSHCLLELYSAISANTNYNLKALTNILV